MEEVEYHKSSNGDRIWLTSYDGESEIVKVIAASGNYFEVGKGSYKLRGLRLWWCYIVAAWIRFCYECQRELNP